MNPLLGAADPGMLSGLHVMEVVREVAEYCGLTLVGRGGNVITAEPPGGSPTRRVVPFFGDGAGSQCSARLWAYHHSKRSIMPDLECKPTQMNFFCGGYMQKLRTKLRYEGSFF